MKHVTAGRMSRLCVYEQLSDAAQDSGLLVWLMDGNLDAPEHIPCGSVRSGHRTYQSTRFGTYSTTSRSK